MTPEQARPGMRVRVMEHHRVEERRGLVGTIVARYGVGEYVAVDVRLADGQYRMFWPMDLDEIPPPTGMAELPVRWGRIGLTRTLIHPSAWKGNSRKSKSSILHAAGPIVPRPLRSLLPAAHAEGIKR